MSAPERPLSNQGYGAPPQRERRTDRKAIAALVLGIAGLFILPIVLSTLAIVFGGMSMRDTRQDPSLGGRGLAIAGVVLGVIGLVLGVIVLGLVIAS